MEMKKFHDIENLREQEIELGNGITRKSNCLGFLPGHIISITEKIDGANASMCYESETAKLLAFSRRQQLDFKNTLDGFFNYVQLMTPEEFKEFPEYVIFGEWLLKNKITYNKENMHKWYIYDIYDKSSKQWLLPDDVKAFAKEHHLEYVHELYYGPFISWEHCKSFCNSPKYGEQQEGIVVRDVTEMQNENRRYPAIIKIVNESFAETKRQRIVDPQVEAEKASVHALMECVVTETRVEKELSKMRDDGIIPSELVPEDMKVIAKNLPRRIWEDVLKEESEVVERAGKYASKMCNSITMQIARNLVVG